MTEDRHGKVVTFYSYKGGTGRTMALANVAWILAANGKRVLVADWDLESPGLHKFFKPFVKQAAVFDNATGVIELIRNYEWATTTDVPREEQWHKQFARVRPHAFSLEWTFPHGGTLDFLSAGRQDQSYTASVYGMNWDNFYGRLGGGAFLDALRADMKSNYDYALIDSRTGLSDVADICTIHLPDILVDCFTFSEQGIEGASRVAASIQQQHSARIRILPVPMRVDLAEKDKADAGRTVAMQRFAGLPAEMTEAERDAYWAAVEVPYRPFYAYEETLATFGDRPGSPTSLLAAYETIARHVTGGEVIALPPVDEAIRARTVAQFVRHVTVAEEKVSLRYAPEDRVWAEWIGRLLASAGIVVSDPDGSGDDAAQGGRLLTIISHANAMTEIPTTPRDPSDARPPLAVYVADVRPSAAFRRSASVFIAGQPADVAVERILKLVGHVNTEVDADLGGARYPGDDPVIFNVPARNARFTGRENDLQELRSHLQDRGKAVVLSGRMPIALQGMGGIGKTQVAIEYAHRYRNAYDVVWWVNSDPVTFLDTELSLLAGRLELAPQATIMETARAVLNALSRGTPYTRWLLIFDNAEDVERVGQLLPQGHGHVLITSRNAAWGDRAQPMRVEVFQRRESVAHLRQRVPTILLDEAGRVAELLGDLPIAVAAAGAWLADTGTPVPEYLRHIERHGPANLLHGETNQSVETTWDLSLERLQQRSPAAYRLLQLCSVLAPEIALDLVYSDELAAALEPLDASVSERLYRGALVQQINRLALLKLDLGGGQIQVHRLLQHVVRSRMTDEELAEARHQVHLVLAASRPRAEVDNPVSWPRFRMLWPHLEISDALSCADESVRQLLIERLRYVWISGGLTDGRSLGERIDVRWSELLTTLTDPKERETLQRQLLHLRFNLANIIRDQAKFAESRELDETVLEQQRALLGDNHPHTLMTAGGLAGDLRALGLYAEALKRDEATYAAWSEFFGEDYPRTLTALSNLATSHRLAGDFRAARTRDLAVYERRRIVRGESHPDTLASGTNLGRDLREAGDYEGSVTLLRSVADRYEQAIGPGVPRTLNAWANLAVSLRSTGQADLAAPMLESAYEQLNDALGPSSPDTLACRLSRAVNLLAVGEDESASTEMHEVWRAYGASLGPRHPHTVACVNNRAAVARAIRDRRTARDLAEHASRDFGQVLGPDHPYTLAAQMNLAIFQAEDGAVGPAYDLIRATAGRLIEVLGLEHPDTLRCRANEALILGELEGRSGTEENTMLELLGRAIGAGHPAVVAMRERRYLHRMLDPHPF